MLVFVNEVLAVLHNDPVKMDGQTVMKSDLQTQVSGQFVCVRILHKK